MVVKLNLNSGTQVGGEKVFSGLSWESIKMQRKMNWIQKQEKKASK